MNYLGIKFAGKVSLHLFKSNESMDLPSSTRISKQNDKENEIQ